MNQWGILKILQEYPKGLTSRQISELNGDTHVNTGAKLGRMVKHKMVVRVQLRNKNGVKTNLWLYKPILKLGGD